MHNYAGNIHIHSTYSDGTGSIEEIAAAANAANLDFVIITDHLTRDGAHEEGKYGRTHVIVGVELNQQANHYLAMDTTALIEDYSPEPQKTIDEVNRQGGFGFLAHPFEKGSHLVTEGAAYPWIDWTVSGFTGIELWNYSSQWKGKATSRWKIFLWYFGDRDAPVKTGPPRQCLKLWDAYTREKPVVGIGGTDAHAIKFRVGFYTMEIFPYRDLFHTINTYICLPEKLHKEVPVARKQIMEALKKGNCYICFDRYRGGYNFYFGAFNGSEEIPMGEKTKLKDKLRLQVKAPQRRSYIRLIRNGELICECKSQHLDYKVSTPGTYRAEVYFCPLFGRRRPWIYSNPVYIEG